MFKDVTEHSFRGKSFKVAYAADNNDSHYTHVDELDVREKFLNITSDDVFYDIGCGYGSYALPALAAGAKGAYGWAIDDIHCDGFQASIDLNGWNDRCKIFKSGLHNNTGWYNQTTCEFSFTARDGFSMVSRLDDAMIDHSLLPPTFIKCDTEAAEPEILKGAELILRTFKPRLLIENHEFKRAGVTQDTRALLESFGYVLVEQYLRPNAIVDYSFFQSK